MGFLDGSDAQPEEVQIPTSEANRQYSFSKNLGARGTGKLPFSLDLRRDRNSLGRSGARTKDLSKIGALALYILESSRAQARG